MNRLRGVFRLPSWARRPEPEPAPEAVTEALPPEATPASIAANERLQNRRPSPPAVEASDDAREGQEPQ